MTSTADTSTNWATPGLLVVATQRSWIAKELMAAGSSSCVVVSDLGLDAPSEVTLQEAETVFEAMPAWWTPTEHAARLLKAGVPFFGQAPGVHLLPSINPELCGREVFVTTVQDLLDNNTPCDTAKGLFCKLAEAKHPQFLAQWYPSGNEAADSAVAAKLPKNAVLHVTNTRLDLVREWRFFVKDGSPLTGSLYLDSQGTWDPTRDVFASSAVPQKVYDFVSTVVSDLAAQPDGWVLDVAETSTGQLLVLEANPVWSSNPYSSDLGQVVSTVCAAFRQSAGTSHPWLWKPDPMLVQYAASRPTLIRSAPSWSDVLPANNGAH